MELVGMDIAAYSPHSWNRVTKSSGWIFIESAFLFHGQSHSCRQSPIMELLLMLRRMMTKWKRQTKRDWEREDHVTEWLTNQALDLRPVSSRSRDLLSLFQSDCSLLLNYNVMHFFLQLTTYIVVVGWSRILSQSIVCKCTFGLN